MDDALEYKIPSACFGAGLLIIIGEAFMGGGADEATLSFLAIIVGLGIRIFFGIIACFITAKLLGVSFGELTSAIVKLAAAFTLPGAIEGFIPGGWILGLILYYVMMMKFFDLTFFEAFVMAIISFFVTLGAALVIGILFAAAG